MTRLRIFVLRRLMRWVGVSDDLYTVEPDGRLTVLLGDYGLKCLELEEVNKQLAARQKRN